MPSNPTRTRSGAGFSLIELMVTVAIVGILTSIAYPSYRNYVLRGKVVYATDALSAMSANMERYFQDNRQYTTLTAGSAPYSPCDSTQPNWTSLSTADSFTLSCTTYTATSFTITASGKTGGPTAGFSYTIDQSGNQTTYIQSPAPAAWIPNTSNPTCPASWETRAGTC